MCAHRCQYTPGTAPLEEMRSISASLEREFTRLADMTTAKALSPAVDELTRPQMSQLNQLHQMRQRSAAAAVLALGNAGPGRVCSLLGREGAVDALTALAVKRSSPAMNSEDRVLVLRALSAICCVADCIRRFEAVRLLWTKKTF